VRAGAAGARLPPVPGPGAAPPVCRPVSAAGLRPAYSQGAQLRVTEFENVGLHHHSVTRSCRWSPAFTPARCSRLSFVTQPGLPSSYFISHAKSCCKCLRRRCFQRATGNSIMYPIMRNVCCTLQVVSGQVAFWPRHLHLSPWIHLSPLPPQPVLSASRPACTVTCVFACVRTVSASSETKAIA